MDDEDIDLPSLPVLRSIGGAAASGDTAGLTEGASVRLVGTPAARTPAPTLPRAGCTEGCGPSPASRPRHAPCRDLVPEPVASRGCASRRWSTQSSAPAGDTAAGCPLLPCDGAAPPLAAYRHAPAGPRHGRPAWVWAAASAVPLRTGSAGSRCRG